MSTYKIICKTNEYQASRDVRFKKHSTSAVLKSGLSLFEAQRELLRLYNEQYGCERPFACNWGLAVIQSSYHFGGAHPTSPDGTRTFDDDGYRFSIEEEDDDEKIRE